MHYKIKELHRLITILKNEEGLSDYGVTLLEGYAVGLETVVKNCSIPDVSGSLPSDEEFETALEKEAFRVPYDGSNNFYDEPTLKHWRKCWEWVKNAVSNDR